MEKNEGDKRERENKNGGRRGGEREIEMKDVDARGRTE